MNKEKVYTVRQVASMLGVNARTVQRWIKANRFPNAYKAFEGETAPYLIPEGDFLQLKEQLEKK